MTCPGLLPIQKLRNKMMQEQGFERCVDLPGAVTELDNALQDVLGDVRLLLRVANYVASLASNDKDGDEQRLRLSQQVAAKVEDIVAVGAEMKDVLKKVAPTVGAAAARKEFAPLEPTNTTEEDWSQIGDDATAASASQPSVWSGFYNKTLRERFDVLSLMYPRLNRSKQHAESKEGASNEAVDPIEKLGELPIRTANLMIENCVGVLGIPLGLGLNFVIDGKSYSIPMAVEEPSVVAAASSAAKLVASGGGGFKTATTGNIMTSQIQLVDTPDISAAIVAIDAHRERLLHLANTTLCANMKKRGGGALDVYCRVVTQSSKRHFSHLEDDAYWYTPCEEELSVHASDEHVKYLVVHIDVDVCEAMGANIVNTVAEGLSAEISNITRSRCGLRILTNLCMQRRARSTFEIPVEKLGWKGVAGEQVAERIVEAYNFAAVDPYRAVTNNKGIMNGVDAVAIATGQDWRAIEAAAHCYASRAGQYTSLSRYELADGADGKKVLRGSIEFPIAVGSKGGALQTHPGYASTHTILSHPTSRALSSIMVSVGLAQNFAAIRAIAITGIQKGHMALHARNIAVAAGAPSDLVSELCTYMLGRKSINIETAKEYLHAHAVFSEIQSNSPPISPHPVSLPSMFYVEIPVPQLESNISLNIAFESINKHPQYIAIMPQKKSASGEAKALPPIQQRLLGDKGYNQLEKMFMFLSSLRSVVTSNCDEKHLSSRANLALQNKLQLLSILINIIAYRLLEVRPDVVREFFGRMLQFQHSRELDVKKCRSLLVDVPASDEVLSTGLPLFVALWQVLHYHIEQEVPHTLLRHRLLTEQLTLLDSIVKSFDCKVGPTPVELQDVRFFDFMKVQCKRWQVSMLLLVDSLALRREVVTEDRLAFLGRIGAYLEWEGTIAHDKARFQRAITEGVPNSFVFWMKLRGLDVQRGEDYIADFHFMAEDISSARREAILAERDSTAAEIFSFAAVERVAQYIRDIYQDRNGQRPRKESF
ncbi:TPA: hypothetical protein N0F65_004285 [Lagenidium giganteum]|uniref:Hydroxymethylglutaryl-CoA reductase (NADPH) n=1 Tax=Lagenidium giganteum TaxID=4803 RepID=A0AAV2ZBP3_9STRA|nr:TPA: hypothetical protein N0F65_004285 [Lagenidium giganteum]